VRAVLTSPLCRVRPPAEPVPRTLVGSVAGEIFGRLVRMTDGPGHMPAKLSVAGHLGSMSPALFVQQGTICATQLVDELDPGRHTDRLTEFAFRLPVYAVGSVLGFTPDRLPQLAGWTGDFVRCIAASSTPEQIETGKAAAAHLADAFRALLGRDTLDAVVANRVGYLSQSYEATAGLIGNTLVALGRHGDVRERARSGRGYLGALVREVARYDSPVQNTRRFLAGRWTIAGQEMAEGDAVLVVLAAANRDPAANPDPDRLDPLRRESVTFTFGFGPHSCPGATIATIITEAGVERLLAAGVDPQRLVQRLSYRPSANTRIPTFGPSTVTG
jgi:cytochrome P450